MEEWYKLWEYKGGQSKQWLPGDAIYISNYGNVRLNDIPLSLGNGLWMDEIGNINIVGRGYGKYKTIYRFIYTMAIDNTFNGGHQWQIHHKDRDHSNNNYNNLLKVTGKEHLKIHSTDFLDNDLMNKLESLKQYYKEHYDKRFEYQATFKQWLSDRYNKYYKEVVLPQREKQQEQKQKKRELKHLEVLKRKQEQQKQKQIEQQKLIDAGTHFRCQDGRVMSYEHLKALNAAGLNRDRSYITEEYKERLRKINKENYLNGKFTGRAATEEGEKERRRKISEAMTKKNKSTDVEK